MNLFCPKCNKIMINDVDDYFICYDCFLSLQIRDNAVCDFWFNKGHYTEYNYKFVFRDKIIKIYDENKNQIYCSNSEYFRSLELQESIIYIAKLVDNLIFN